MTVNERKVGLCSRCCVSPAVQRHVPLIINMHCGAMWQKAIAKAISFPKQGLWGVHFKCPPTTTQSELHLEGESGMIEGGDLISHLPPVKRQKWHGNTENMKCHEYMIPPSVCTQSLETTAQSFPSIEEIVPPLSLLMGAKTRASEPQPHKADPLLMWIKSSLWFSFEEQQKTKISVTNAQKGFRGVSGDKSKSTKTGQLRREIQHAWTTPHIYAWRRKTAPLDLSKIPFNISKCDIFTEFRLWL